jgi:hypothetical protein
MMSATSVRTVVLCALVMLAVRAAAGQQPPRFQSSVDVTSVEVTVVDGSGRPVVDLQPRDFAVRVDRSPRRVVNAQWVSRATGRSTEHQIRGRGKRRSCRGRVHRPPSIF